MKITVRMYLKYLTIVAMREVHGNGNVNQNHEIQLRTKYFVMPIGVLICIFLVAKEDYKRPGIYLLTVLSCKLLEATVFQLFEIFRHTKEI